MLRVFGFSRVGVMGICKHVYIFRIFMRMHKVQVGFLRSL